MKIKIVNKSYDEVLKLPKPKHIKPKRQNRLFRWLLKFVSAGDIRRSGFTCDARGMEKLGKNEPALYLMNHSSFIDLEIVATLLYPKPYNIVATTDGFIGKDWLMRAIGCIPTKKFVNDLTLVRDMGYAIHELKSSVVLFPEASYSFDGTATTLPESLARCIKLLKCPVIMIRTFGAFHRDPLYNNLQIRDVKVSATEEYLLSPEDVDRMSCEEINEKIFAEFTFDNFAWQKENHIRVDEPFRADCLNRVLYKCDKCGCEGEMHGVGTELRCNACGRTHTLDEYGYLRPHDGEVIFEHIPTWYAWERECVRREIKEGTYKIEADVDICVTIDTKKLYRIGEGHLTHTKDGFLLVGCDGKLHYEQKTLASYSLYSDFNWYEVGDVICIGNSDILYYCFPKNSGDIVAKSRLAAEELYKIAKVEQKHCRECSLKDCLGKLNNCK